MWKREERDTGAHRSTDVQEENSRQALMAGLGTRLSVMNSSTSATELQAMDEVTGGGGGAGGMPRTVSLGRLTASARAGSALTAAAEAPVDTRLVLKSGSKVRSE